MIKCRAWAHGTGAASRPWCGVSPVSELLPDPGGERRTCPAAGEGYGRARATYVRRRPEDTVLHRVVREHLETFLAEARRRGDGTGVPRFVEKELREFLGCGVLARGFARFRCPDCFREILVAFSCKGRGFCPSCGGRRMAELAAHLVADVLGGLPVRQWVLTLPYRLRYALAWDHRLCRAVLAVCIRALLAFERRRARRRGVRQGRGGAVTAIQRFGSALNTNVHFHTLAIQGVFSETPDGERRFLPAPAPSDADVGRLLATIRQRVVRLVARRGIDLAHAAADEAGDERQWEWPAYAAIQGAAVVGRAALGRHAGRAVVRRGAQPERRPERPRQALHAHLDGFDLHAAVAVPAGDRSRLAHLCRYVLRPPLAQQRLEATSDGKVVVGLRRPWSDGTRAVCFEPLEFLEKLAAMIPKPRINLLLYHGVVAPHARLRPEAVRRARQASPPEVASTGEAPPTTSVPGAQLPAGASVRAAPAGPMAARPPPRRRFAWADLLRRTFAIDVLACPECGGQLRLIACIDAPAVIEKILRHLGLPTQVPEPVAARQQEWFPGLSKADDCPA